MTEKQTLFEVGRFTGLLLLWMVFLTLLKYVFCIPIQSEIETAISILYVVASAFLCFPIVFQRERA
jgi:hypothetical protein